MSESDFTLGPDGVAEEEAILARLKANLAGGRVYDQITDEMLEALGNVGEIAPYCVVDFGAAYPTGKDRIVGAGELSEPYAMAVGIACWGSKTADVRRLAGAVRRVLIGWAPTAGSAPMTGMGSAGFSSQPARVQVPSRTMRMVMLQLTFNLSIPEPA
jgi:hypothetical protein